MNDDMRDDAKLTQHHANLYLRLMARKSDERRGRVLTLAREMMLAQMANPEIDEFHFGNMVSLAEAWIRDEDAYVLPEDMQ